MTTDHNAIHMLAARVMSETDGDTATVVQAVVDAILAAGHCIPCSVTAVDELDSLPNESVIRDRFGDVFEKRADKWCGYETEALSSHAMRKYLPATVLWTPGGAP
ncbi:hypothetical protein [Rhodococcus ruber]|uniref:hypothetical protein n=1 Tax=Rhodococcus ruber TaxID=1830 RepID=UPI0037842874